VRECGGKVVLETHMLPGPSQSAFATERVCMKQPYEVYQQARLRVQTGHRRYSQMAAIELDIKSGSSGHLSVRPVSRRRR